MFINTCGLFILQQTISMLYFYFSTNNYLFSMAGTRTSEVGASFYLASLS